MSSWLERLLVSVRDVPGARPRAKPFGLAYEDPLLHLVLTAQTPCVTTSGGRRRWDPVALAGFARALLLAEKKEPGFGWKLAAYLADSTHSTLAAAILSASSVAAAAAAADPALAEERLARCLRGRTSDAVLFLAWFHDLELGDPPPLARRGIARVLTERSEAEILAAARRTIPLSRKRKNGARATLRLTDALGVAREHLGEPHLTLYRYLHAPTSARREIGATIPLIAARRAFYEDRRIEDFERGRLAPEQLLSALGSNPASWSILLESPGLLSDRAFLRHVRAIHRAGAPVASLLEMAKARSFEGVWPHESQVGYRAALDGATRRAPNGRVALEIPPAPELAPVFEVILERAAAPIQPDVPMLGVADVSGSMFGARLGGARGPARAGEVALVLSAVMSKSLGYAATFDDDVYFMDRQPAERLLDFAHALRQGRGVGSTQVPAALLGLVKRLLAEPARVRPRAVVFFSDLPFHPPELQVLPEGREELFREIGVPVDPALPPLAAALAGYRSRIGPVSLVLWNLAASAPAPLPSTIPGVLMLAGMHDGSFARIRSWIAAGSPPTAADDGKGTARPDPRALVSLIREL